jgi:hypothetical protein
VNGEKELAEIIPNGGGKGSFGCDFWIAESAWLQVEIDAVVEELLEKESQPAGLGVKDF